MPELGYSLSSEEFSASDLVRFARRADEAGFSFAVISDHFHPWTSKQGQSPFVWSVIGAIAATTKRIRLGTGVTRDTETQKSGSSINDCSFRRAARPLCLCVFVVIKSLSHSEDRHTSRQHDR